MGKTYLNANDKNMLYLYAAMTTKYDECIDSAVGSKNTDKELVKLLRLVKTYTGKLIGKILDSIDPSQKNGVMRQIDSYRICVDYEDKVKKKLAERNLLDSEFIMETDDIDLIIKLALASCSVCDSTGEDVESCPYRKVFLKYGIDVIDCDCENGSCPYSFQSVGGLSKAVN